VKPLQNSLGDTLPAIYELSKSLGDIFLKIENMLLIRQLTLNKQARCKNERLIDAT
jgi:hypothetical protein